MTAPLPDRSTEPAAAPCTLHSIAAILIVSANVPEGVEAFHLVEYIRAFLENRAPELHEDIVDELTRKPMQVVGHEIHPALAPVLFPAFEAESPAKGGGSMSAALDLVLRELHRAKLKWPHFADSLDHALDVLDEERDELAAAILNDDIQGPHGVIREAAQVSAVAIRIIEYCLKAQSREEATMRNAPLTATETCPHCQGAQIVGTSGDSCPYCGGSGEIPTDAAVVYLKVIAEQLGPQWQKPICDIIDILQAPRLTEEQVKEAYLNGYEDGNEDGRALTGCRNVYEHTPRHDPDTAWAKSDTRAAFPELAGEVKRG